MPLHLLGKKSWNVYNPENVARVKRDEAQAKALEEEDERRMQEVDAERRIQILRGERPSTPPPPPPRRLETAGRHDGTSLVDAGRNRKRRRIAGEDDTQRDIRIAQEDAAQTDSKRRELALTSRGKGSTEAPILDSSGHINLFPAPAAHEKAEKNKDAEAEAERKKRSYEDQYTMRFSNAAGFKEKVGRQPWYSSSAQTAIAPDSMPDKNVWGNEDPMRIEREKARMDSSDPLAAMKRGVRQLKTTQQERKRWNEEKQKEVESLKLEEHRRLRHNHRRRSRSVDSLEGFQLDVPAAKDGKDQHRKDSHRRHSSHHHPRHRDRSHDRSRRKSRQSSDRSHRHSDARDDTRRSRKSESETLKERH